MKNVHKVFYSLLAFYVFAGLLYAEEQQTPSPKKVEVDRNYDGKSDRFEYYDSNGSIIRVETDTDFNGKADEWVYYKNGIVEKAEKDTNGDGKPDTWLAY